MTDRYGNERVKRGLLHFGLGKMVSAVAGLLAMLLVVRGLSVTEFAGYSVLVALVEVFTALSGLGLAHVVLRYVPELYATHRTISLRSLVAVTLGVRTGALVAILLLVYRCSLSVAHLLNLDSMIQAFELFLLVVAFRSTSHFLSQILESTLHQGISQMAFSASAIGRCVGMLWLLQSGTVSLIDVIVLELLCDVMACCLLGGGIVYILKPSIRTEDSPDKDASWWLSQRASVVKFAALAYLQHLATLPFGGNTNRLVGGAMFGDRVMATFGFAQSLYEYFKRYLPTQLLVGLIRPVVVARFSISNNFAAAAALCDQALHVNLVFLFGSVAVLLVAGPELLLLLSAGKYGTDSLWLLIAMLVLLGLESLRLVLEVLTQTVKHYELMIPNNLFLSASVLLGIGGYTFIGALSFPLANALALLCANFWLIHRLRHFGYFYKHDWRGTALIFMVFCVAVIGGVAAKWLGVNWIWVGLITACIYSALFSKFLIHESMSFVRELVGKRP